MTALQPLLAGSFTYYAERTSRRLAGLTDEEYLWEPVPGCWTIRPGPDGFVADSQWPPPDPPPLTTIAWRLAHICSFLRAHGMRAVAFERGKAAWGVTIPPPGDAAGALAAFEAAVAAWQHDLDTVDEQRLWELMGPEAKPFDEQPVAGFVEHIHDESIHHTAEVALLRDLYRVRADL